MPDPRIKCGAGKSGMTNEKKKGFSKLLPCIENWAFDNIIEAISGT
jgi:hypothetical protein